MRVHIIPLQEVEIPNRLVLGKLHRVFAGPFRVSDASDILDMPREGTRKLLAYLASRGWLSRVRHGLYATIPLETSNVEAWFADPWVVAAKTFPPCYIGGWTALHHWELTEQLFRPVVVFSTKRVRSKERFIQVTTFRIRQLKKGQLFGTKPVWRERARVQLSDPERTLVDTLDHPEIGGGCPASTTLPAQRQLEFPLPTLLPSST